MHPYLLINCLILKVVVRIYFYIDNFKSQVTQHLDSILCPDNTSDYAATYLLEFLHWHRAKRPKSKFLNFLKFLTLNMVYEF